MNDDLEAPARAQASPAKPTKEEVGPAVTRSDVWFLWVLFGLVLVILGRMAWKDMNLGGAEVHKCADDQEKIAKHLHCISTNGTTNFAAFLANQGAKKQHPNYEKERERVQKLRSANSSRLGSGGGSSSSTHRSASGGPSSTSTKSIHAASGFSHTTGQKANPCHPPCEAQEQRDDADDPGDDFYDPDVRA